MSRRNEQYTHGRFRKYVHMKKRKMKMGEAFVGMNSRGSQLKNMLAQSRGFQAGFVEPP